MTYKIANLWLFSTELTFSTHDDTFVNLWSNDFIIALSSNLQAEIYILSGFALKASDSGAQGGMRAPAACGSVSGKNRRGKERFDDKFHRNEAIFQTALHIFGSGCLE